MADSDSAADLSVLDELITDVQTEAGPGSPEDYDSADAGDEGEPSAGSLRTTSSASWTASCIYRVRLAPSAWQCGGGMGLTDEWGDWACLSKQTATPTMTETAIAPLRSGRPLLALLLARQLSATVSQKDLGYASPTLRLRYSSPLAANIAAIQGDAALAPAESEVRAAEEGGRDADTEGGDLGKSAVEFAAAADGEVSVSEGRDGNESLPVRDEGCGNAIESPPSDRHEEETSDGDGGGSYTVPGASNSAVGQSEAAVAADTAHETRADDEGEDGGDDREAEALPHPVRRALCEEDVSMPPPAPTRAAVVLSGSMNPGVDDDGSDDSDSDEEGGDGTHGGDQDNSLASQPSPALLPFDSTEEDEDELEVDPAVASTILPVARAAKAVEAAVVAEVALKAGAPEYETKAEAAAVGFGDEVRVASVVVESAVDSAAMSSSSSSSWKDADGFSVAEKVAKAEPQHVTGGEDAFGIAYQSSKKRLSRPTAGGSDEYSLSKGPAFPDEKEFESEVQINSDASFSGSIEWREANRELGDAGDAPDGGAGEGEDDEFSFAEAGDEAASVEAAVFSEQELEARRAALAASKARQEAELLEELRRATDDERRTIEAAERQREPGGVGGAEPEAGESLSLGELHSMYRRGLGDQSVLFLDEAEAVTAGGAAEGAKAGPKAADAPVQRLSVMGRLLSKPRAPAEVIVEGENEDDDQEGDAALGLSCDEMSAGDAARLGVRADQQTLLSHGDEDEDEDENEDVDGTGGWKEIQLVERAAPPPIDGQAAVGPAPPPPPSQWRISYTESAGYFAEAPEFLEQRSLIKPEDFPARASCLACLSRPRLTFSGAVDERDRVFCAAAMPFDPANDVFCRMLQTVYARLVPTTTAPPLVGGHWEQVGFQGNDPATDLRGVGVLALLQMLHLVESHGELARRLHSLSQHGSRHFPFACALVNATLQCLLALRTGALYPECNKHASVVAGLNTLFVAIASELTAELAASADAAGAGDVPLLLQRVFDRARLQPLATIRAASDASPALGPSFDGGPAASAASASHLGPPPSPASPRSRPSASTNVEFTEIALHSVADD